MNDTANRMSPAARLRHELRSLAPHVDQDWAEEFVTEQRLLDSPGDQIGDSLATVDSHVADSGETAGGRAGPARTYARELVEPEGTPRMRLHALLCLMELGCT